MIFANFVYSKGKGQKALEEAFGSHTPATEQQYHQNDNLLVDWADIRDSFDDVAFIRPLKAGVSWTFADYGSTTHDDGAGVTHVTRFDRELEEDISEVESVRGILKALSAACILSRESHNPDDSEKMKNARRLHAQATLALQNKYVAIPDGDINGEIYALAALSHAVGKYSDPSFGKYSNAKFSGKTPALICKEMVRDVLSCFSKEEYVYQERVKRVQKIVEHYQDQAGNLQSRVRTSDKTIPVFPGDDDIGLERSLFLSDSETYDGLPHGRDPLLAEADPLNNIISYDTWSDPLRGVDESFFTKHIFDELKSSMKFGWRLATREPVDTDGKPSDSPIVNPIDNVNVRYRFLGEDQDTWVGSPTDQDSFCRKEDFNVFKFAQRTLCPGKTGYGFANPDEDPDTGSELNYAALMDKYQERFLRTSGDAFFDSEQGLSKTIELSRQRNMPDKALVDILAREAGRKTLPDDENHLNKNSAINEIKGHYTNFDADVEGLLVFDEEEYAGKLDTREEVAKEIRSSVTTVTGLPVGADEAIAGTGAAQDVFQGALRLKKESKFEDNAKSILSTKQKALDVLGKLIKALEEKLKNLEAQDKGCKSIENKLLYQVNVSGCEHDDSNTCEYIDKLAQVRSLADEDLDNFLGVREIELAVLWKDLGPLRSRAPRLFSGCSIDLATTDDGENMVTHSGCEKLRDVLILLASSEACSIKLNYLKFIKSNAKDILDKVNAVEEAALESIIPDLQRLLMDLQVKIDHLTTKADPVSPLDLLIFARRSKKIPREDQVTNVRSLLKTGSGVLQKVMGGGKTAIIAATWAFLARVGLHGYGTAKGLVRQAAKTFVEIGNGMAARLPTLLDPVAPGLTTCTLNVKWGGSGGAANPPAGLKTAHDLLVNVASRNFNFQKLRGIRAIPKDKTTANTRVMKDFGLDVINEDNVLVRVTDACGDPDITLFF